MKRLIICVLAVVLAYANGTAQTVTVADVEALPGETVTFVLNLSGGKADTYTSLQFDAEFPAGFTTTGDYSISPKWKNASATVGDVIDGVATIPVSSAEVIAGTDVEGLFSVDFTVGQNVALGEYEIALRKITFGYGFIDKDIAPDVTFTVKVVNAHTVVLDENATAIPETAESVNVRVRRTINANSWSTICLPFAMTEEQVTSAFGTDVELADFTSWSSEEDDDGNIVAISVGFTDVTEIEANHPYIIKVKNAITEFTADGVDIEAEEEPSVMVGKKKAERGYMIGNYVAGTTIPENDLFLNGSKFWYSKGLSTMKAFRAYFEFADVLTNVEEAGARIVLSFPDEPTGIDAMSKHIDYDGQTYNLLGEKVTDTLRKGIYIRDGKKMVVK